MKIKSIFNSMGFAGRHGKLGSVIQNLVDLADSQGDAIKDTEDAVKEQKADITALQTLVNKLKAAATVTVSFDSDGGTSISPQVIPFGTKATAPTPPTKDDYSFAGWYLGTESFDFDTLLEAHTVLTAQWTANGGGET